MFINKNLNYALSRTLFDSAVVSSQASLLTPQASAHISKPSPLDPYFWYTVWSPFPCTVVRGAQCYSHLVVVTQESFWFLFNFQFVGYLETLIKTVAPLRQQFFPRVFLFSFFLFLCGYPVCELVMCDVALRGYEIHCRVSWFSTFVNRVEETARWIPY